MSRILGSILLVFFPLVTQATGESLRWCKTGDETESLPVDRIRVLSLNISHGRNTSPNQLLVSKSKTYENLDRIAELLVDQSPDVVALQEADAASRWSGKFDHVAYLGEQAGLECGLHGLHSRTWISNYGTALLSDIRPMVYTSMPFAPSWPSKQKGFVWATFDWTAGDQVRSITFVSVHLDFLRDKVRDSQIDEISAELARIDGPLVVMGDLNSEWNDPASQVKRLADELDLYAYEPDKEGMGTYKGRDGKRLDWILISRELEFINYRLLPDIVSDHLAVYAEIGPGAEWE